MLKGFTVTTDVELQILTSVLYAKDVSYFIHIEEVNGVRYYLVYTPDVENKEQMDEIYKTFITVKDMPHLNNKM